MSVVDINYKVTVPGKYTYLCIAHSGMVGSFTATGAAAPAGPAAPADPAPTDPAPADPAPADPAPADPAAPAPGAAAVTHNVATGPGNVFTPADLAVNVGDSVSITGLGSHPTKSDVFPAGAAPIAMSVVDINYKVTVPGKYTYLCIAHSGMVGSFTATGAAAPGGAAAGTPAAETPAAETPAAGTPAAETPAAETPAAGTAPAGSQVTSIPVGGVQTGGGSTAGFTHSGLVTLGGGLIMIAFMGMIYSRKLARQE